MGKTIETVANDRGHKITAKITSHNHESLTLSVWENTDVVIEFSTPDSALSNIQLALEMNKPVVCGTTGWLHRLEEVKEMVNKTNGTFFYASNFSIGVNIFFRINRYLAQIMEHNPDYDVSMKEIHHLAKKDAPSGTAITLAEDIVKELGRKSGWDLKPDDISKIHIASEREGEVPGTHIVTYDSDIDFIEIKHEAKTRKGFATGAVLVSEWIVNKKGVLTMDDFLNF